MLEKYPEYTGLNLPLIAPEILKHWEQNKVFELSISKRENCTPFVFFEGPPSANGLPGIHHVMGRTIKDLFCRYKTLKGFQVKRKAGWDTHGLPVELGVEKELGITKEDIGKTISIDDYNLACKNAVMRYTDIWNDLTTKMGYWVDKEDPYVTYETKYMESVWWLIGELYKKNLMYKGYTIQPYSPKAGTGLSTHELNQPDCYKTVKDTSVTAMFRANSETLKKFNVELNHGDTYFLAWTTTPWTLPSNTALTVGDEIEYALVATYNQYTFEAISVVLAKKLVDYQFGKGFHQAENESTLKSYKSTDNSIPYLFLGSCSGKQLIGTQYEQLLPYCLPDENPSAAFRVISGDFVTTDDGTGIVHTAPTFGADDARVAKLANIPAMLVRDENDSLVPLVNLQGKFRKEVVDFAGMYVKNEYYPDGEAPERSVDVQIAIKLKQENKAFKVEKYEHSYPHCWRTDKPILYYPLDSWFIRVSNNKERLVKLNNTINWQPASTGQGRFGKWLENANDWNLSRSRYWGIPIPIWSTEDGKERRCITALSELKIACQESVSIGFMETNPLAAFDENDLSNENYERIDIHKHQVDKIILIASNGEQMKRESDLIDVWFDSGAMPYAQWHYPFENKELIDKNEAFPADFIAEGVDQTRGWFYTLHTIAALVFDKVAYKNVLSNGLVLDKDGIKMSKRLGNSVDPFETLEKFGPDATRWYMVTNAQPWDNLKFNVDGITEVQRKFFGTLYNTYSFFALYANIDQFDSRDAEIALVNRPEIDRWIISKLNSLIQDVDAAFSAYEPTKAGRLIQEFVCDQLSNWYVRLCRRRFWKSDDAVDKRAAYQTLYTCLKQVTILASPIAPFFMDRLFLDLTKSGGTKDIASVHLCDFPLVNESEVDRALESRMLIAQRLSSLVLGLRKKEKIRVRQPLARLLVPVLNNDFAKSLTEIQDLILSEVNVKTLSLIKDDGEMLVKNIKPNFKSIGKKFGGQMKSISAKVASFEQVDIRKIEESGLWEEKMDGVVVTLELTDFEITAKDIPGWLVANDGELTVALDITITEELQAEGIAREFVNRIQTLRKERNFEVSDRIIVSYTTTESISTALKNNAAYICAEILADMLDASASLTESISLDIETEGDLLVFLKRSTVT